MISLLQNSQQELSMHQKELHRNLEVQADIFVLNGSLLPDLALEALQLVAERQPLPLQHVQDRVVLLLYGLTYDRYFVNGCHGGNLLN